ncbi:N-acetylmuramic acid 6-phosphate etherase [Frigidibacter sp. RF13]|uniref:N-acetylmuramic acid 6-phosphate etherase n=1 Tax=Frigidibacter sp. RF13 TaxID=2997340 RepID=UPI0022709B75|nr:N-acetylmuramic acid 6-phosphate etherase [Frigidibacter sp. RF13]MCY1125641.1 N-acetylmuramic acid 6-phosphate etherase [Frigidibacter sp. RF13]
MADKQTENLHADAAGLDARPVAEILALLLSGQAAAVAAVERALPDIAQGARLMADAIAGGGRLVYAGAGSSALMANADGMELPGTYGIPAERILLCMAGGIPTDAHMPGDTEDDGAAGAAAGVTLGAGDLVIAVTASGSTPYPLELARAARRGGARIVAIANNRNAPIFELADASIALLTPPELIAGSTRMGAGTAQKVALNLLSTLAAIQLGQVHDGMMVGLKADNTKLRARAAGIVATIAEVRPAAAIKSLEATGGDTKAAVLVALGQTPGEARAMLATHHGNLRAALARLRLPAANAGEIANQGSSL